MRGPSTIRTTSVPSGSTSGVPRSPSSRRRCGSSASTTSWRSVRAIELGRAVRTGAVWRVAGHPEAARCGRGQRRQHQPAADAVRRRVAPVGRRRGCCPSPSRRWAWACSGISSGGSGGTSRSPWGSPGRSRRCRSCSIHRPGRLDRPVAARGRCAGSAVPDPRVAAASRGNHRGCLGCQDQLPMDRSARGRDRAAAPLLPVGRDAGRPDPAHEPGFRAGGVQRLRLRASALVRRES